MTKHRPDRDPDDIEFAENKLAESRSRLKKLRELQRSFLAGSAERAQAASILDEMEVLHELLERLCRRIRGRLH